MNQIVKTYRLESVDLQGIEDSFSHDLPCGNYWLVVIVYITLMLIKSLSISAPTVVFTTLYNFKEL